MNVLVTGSAGFLGRSICHALEERGDLVIPVDVVDPDFPMDCRNYFRTQLFDFDLVIHLAAMVGGRENIDFNAAMLGAHNVQCDGALFEWALKTKPGRVVYFSSAAAYPVIQQTPHPHRLLQEDGTHFGGVRDYEPESMFPDETYGWAKLTGEVLAESARTQGLNVSVVRPFSCYSPDQNPLEYPFPAFIQRAKAKDDPFVIWGDGTAERDFIHVTDLINALLIIIDQGIEGPINLGTGVATSFNDLANMVCSFAGYKSPPRFEHLLDKPIGVQRRVADITKLTEFYTPAISIEEGVRRAFA